MIDSLIRLMYIFIVVLIGALMTCTWLLRKSRPVKTQSQSLHPPANETARQEERRAAAQAAVQQAIDSQGEAQTHRASVILPSPVSPWQQALRATALHRKPARR